MKKLKKPRWMSAEDWQAYQEQTAEWDARLLQVLRCRLAEARADLDADRAARYPPPSVLFVRGLPCCPQGEQGKPCPYVLAKMA